MRPDDLGDGMSWLHTVPLLVIGLLFLALLFAGVEVGYLGYGWLKRRTKTPAAPESGQDHLLSAVLGLLALLLGFTFSLALDRYEVRRDLVLQEANAIGTTWLRVQLLQEPNRSNMRALLREYVDARLAWSEGSETVKVEERTQVAQEKLWQVMGVTMRTDPQFELSKGVMDAMNSTFDLANSRVVARSAHIPGQVLAILLLYAFLSMVLLGYILAINGQPHRIATGLLLVLLTLALVVILDLDRPLNGAIQVSQAPLVALKDSLR